MTNYDDLFALAKKLGKALAKDNSTDELKTSDLFDDDTKDRIRKELSEDAREHHLDALRAIDTKEDWEKVVSKLEPKKTASSFRYFYKVAAAILICGALGYITFYHSDITPKVEQNITTITPGTDKAILTLQNGVNVALEKKQPYENETVFSNGELLDYSKASGNTNSKVEFNYLTIPRGGQYQIQLSDGTLVWLNADTKLKYPVAFKSGNTRSVELLYGEAYFDVSPSSKHNGSAFKVLTKDQEVEVLGTEFNIKAYNDENYMYTTLVEGQINVLFNGTLERLSPSEQTAIHTSTKQITKSVVNIDQQIAWLKGYFNFKDTSLKEIMRVMSRWYDVQITFESNTLEDVKFSGLLSKTQNIEDILNGIQNTKFINAYEIKNNTIIIK